MSGSLDRVNWTIGGMGLATGVLVAALSGCAHSSKSVKTDTSGGSATVGPDAGDPSSGNAFVLRIDRKASISAEPPPGIDADAVRPLRGEALDRAQTSLKKIRAALPLPKELRDAPGAPAEHAAVDPAAPSLETQRLFAAALQQGLEGQGSQAVRLLEAAILQSPQEPTLLRRLARGWASLGNRVRATAYFRQAVFADAEDLESVVSLGRLLVESGEAEEGTAALLQASEQPEALAAIDPALEPLTRFYASAGLRLLGYTQASAELLDGFLDGPPPDGLRPTRYGAELLFLMRRSAVHEVARGDLQARLGDFRSARLAYERARRGGAAGDDLTRRVVYADLWLGRIDQATEEVLGAVQAQSASPASLGLVEYLVGQGVPAEPIIRGLRALPANDQDADATTLALASALPREAAIALLSEALDESPASDRLYEKLLALLLEETATPDDRTLALRKAAAAIEADPAQAARRAGALLALAGTDDLEPLREAFDAMPSDQRSTPAMATLEAVVLLELGDIDAARAKLDTALASEAPPTLARIEKARLLALEGKFQDAQALLETVEPDAQDPRLGQLRVGVLLNLDRAEEALVLLNELIELQPGDARFAVQKSRLLLREKRIAEAERTLLDALTANPQVEALYAELLELYDTHGPELDDHPQGYQRLVRRMLETIPESRIARLTYAGILEVRGNTDQAERLLDTIIEQNPNDRDALLILLDVYLKTDRVPQAGALAERLLATEPRHPDVVRSAVKLAQLLVRQGQTEQALALLDAGLEGAEPAHAGALHFVTIQVLRDQPLEVSEARLKRLVSDEAVDAQLRKIAAYTLGSAYEAAGRPADTDAVFLALLEAMPEDPELSNHIGYVWAHAGRRLDEAERLIARALEANKDESAFLDSMGWVRYKHGDLAGAERWLRRATQAEGGDNPVIVDHLGDTLYRLGRIDEAQAMWERAREGMNDPRNVGTGDPETDTIVERTTAKLDALAAERAGNGGAVPVAPLGEGVAVEQVESAPAESLPATP